MTKFVTGEKKYAMTGGLNLGRLRDRRTFYHVAIKAGLFHKAVQVYHTPTPGDTLMCKMSWKKMFDVMHFASDLHLNRFCLVRVFAYLMKKSA